MQFSNSHFGHGLFDPLIVTFQGQTLFRLSMLPKAPHIQKQFCSYHAGNAEKLGIKSSPVPFEANGQTIELQSDNN